MQTIIRKTLRTTQAQELTNPKKGDWIAITDATQNDLDQITKITGLDNEDIHDVMDEYEVPRVEKQDDNIIIFLRIPRDSSLPVATSTLEVISSRDHLITISTESPSLLVRLQDSPTMPPTTQPGKLLTTLMLKIAQSYTKNIKILTDRVLRQKRKSTDISTAAITQLTQDEDVLNQYLSALVSMKSVYQSILTGKYVKLYAEDSDIFDDLIISINQSVDVCSTNLKSIRSLRDAYQIIFTNDLNKTMKLLTSLTIILTIPTIIASIYGMNIPLPLSQSQYAFSIVSSIGIATVALVVAIFYKRKWF